MTSPPSSTLMTGLCIGLVGSLVTYNVLSYRLSAQTAATIDTEKQAFNRRKKKDFDGKVSGFAERMLKRPKLGTTIEDLTYGFGSIALVTGAVKQSKAAKRDGSLRLALDRIDEVPGHQELDSDIEEQYSQAQHHTETTIEENPAELEAERLPSSPFRPSPRKSRRRMVYRVKGAAMNEDSTITKASKPKRRRWRPRRQLGAEKTPIFDHIFENSPASAPVALLNKGTSKRKARKYERKVEILSAVNCVKSA